jgi:hypothetical protein
MVLMSFMISKKSCVRCGHCCTQYFTVIVVIPELGPRKDNIRSINMLEERCPHLEGDRPGEYSCRIHEYEWFKDTPCGQYNSDGCTLGEYIISNSKKDD